MPVLLGPVLAGLNIKSDGTYVDGTFGRGGHASAILEQLGASGRLIGIDRDPQALAEAPDAIRNDPRVELLHGRFSEIARYAHERQLTGKVDGVLLDLGVSSPQLDEAERGFSFRTDGPLDMRMDPTGGQSAADWIEKVDRMTLRKVIATLGEERHAGRIADAIVAARRDAPLTRTKQLADIVSAAVPGRGERKHKATRTFQAIRLFLNRELEELDAALATITDVLRPGGRLAVVSFHSLEDRRVKRFMRDASNVPAPYRGLPEVPEQYRPTFRVVGKPVSASAQEVEDNARARSARLRVAERL